MTQNEMATADDAVWLEREIAESDLLGNTGRAEVLRRVLVSVQMAACEEMRRLGHGGQRRGAAVGLAHQTEAERPARCPFCGQEPYAYPESDEDGFWFVTCMCGASGPSATEEPAAVTAWNERRELPDELR